ncbi:MAG TPA: four helix bundle protein [Candidatus Acidoferrum sp.]|jgi:four helix bundle protein|nr:four helix bundle protein [Candidatus Acidoferrum sp.]
MNTANPDDSSTAPTHPGPTRILFDHEKLHVYQLLLRFITWVTPLIEETKKVAAGKTREVCDQLDRASLSALLNTAEGNGKRRGQVRAKYFDDARGSATECAACLDALVAKRVFTLDRIFEGKAMLVPIVSMLCGLVDRFDKNGDVFHEDSVEYQVGYDPIPEPRKRMRMRKRKNKAD